MLSLLIPAHHTLITYLDPGSGSLFLQILLGGAAGLGLAFRHLYRKFKQMTHREKAKE